MSSVRAYRVARVAERPAITPRDWRLLGHLGIAVLCPLVAAYGLIGGHDALDSGEPDVTGARSLFLIGLAFGVVAVVGTVGVQRWIGSQRTALLLGLGVPIAIATGMVAYGDMWDSYDSFFGGGYGTKLFLSAVGILVGTSGLVCLGLLNFEKKHADLWAVITLALGAGAAVGVGVVSWMFYANVEDQAAVARMKNESPLGIGPALGALLATLACARMRRRRTT